MVIERGAEWGRPGLLGADAAVATTDAEAATLVTAGEAAIRLAGGDLATTLGVRSVDRPAGMLLPVDAIEVVLDERPPILALAHVVAGRWRERTMDAVMNAAFLGPANLAPRAHPGDGRLDIVRMELGVRDRWRARRRAVTATHVPHPDIRVTRASTWEHRWTRPMAIRVDGTRYAPASRVRCTVIPEAVIIGV